MANTTNFGWETPDDTDLVKDGAAAMRTLGNSIDASFVDLKGGTTGQVLAKASNTDLDFTWSAAGLTNPLTTTGDLIYSSSGSTAARLGIGTTGQILTVSGGIPTWTTPAGGGKILQVVSASYSTTTSITTTTYTDSGLSASITPSATSSKILVLVVHNNKVSTSNLYETQARVQLLRSSTQIQEGSIAFRLGSSGSPSEFVGNTDFMIVDSPNTTSSVTYKTQGQTVFSNSTLTMQYSKPSTMILMEIGA